MEDAPETIKIQTRVVRSPWEQATHAIAEHGRGGRNPDTRKSKGKREAELARRFTVHPGVEVYRNRLRRGEGYAL